MKRRVFSLIGFTALALGLIIPTEAQAIPAFARLYGIECSACHSAYPELNVNGEGFRLSGYRRFAGGTLTPTKPPLKIGKNLELPGIVPLSFSLKAGYNYTALNNTLADGSENTNTAADFKRIQSSFNLNDFEFLAGTPLGNHVSFFLDTAMAETEIRQFWDPETRTHGAKFTLEGPELPELVFAGVNDILVRDLLNIKMGAIELPTAFSAHHRRLSFFPYLVYNAQALDVIADMGIDDYVEVPGVDEEGLEHNQFRLSTGQVGVEVYGRATPSLLGISNLNVDYFVGVVNGNNVNVDNNNAKDVFGRLVGTYTSGSTTVAVGGFGYYSWNTLDSLTTQPETGVAYKDRLWRAGPDVSITLNKPLYVKLYSQILFAEDSNPTGFGVDAKWWGGFVQADVKPIDQIVLYGRYDWINGDQFDDTGVMINGVSGETGPVDPSLWDVVIGAQYYVYENVKLIAEYRHGEKDLQPTSTSVDQLKNTKEDAVFVGFQVAF